MHDVEEIVAKVQAAGVILPRGRIRIDGFGDSSALSESLLDLIRLGRKRAGTSLLWAIEAEGETVPSVGDIEVVVDYTSEPVFVTRITHVEVLPFDKVSADYAAIEGEGDGSLEYWIEGHWSFFSRECERLGREPTRSMPVVCAVFELLASVPRGVN